MREDLLGLINLIRDELILVMDERLSILQVDWEVGLHEAPEVCFREFDAYRAPRFFGGNESVMIMH